MKRACVVLLTSALTVFLGCSNKSEPGGPGARRTDNKSPITGAPKNETFRVSIPVVEPTVKQGEQKEVDVAIDRSKDFKQDVTLTFKADKGITVTPATHTIKANDKDTTVKVKVAADKDAPVGDAVVHVTAKPETGDSTATEFKVSVKGA
jgi:uncharacterized membrane protein